VDTGDELLARLSGNGLEGRHVDLDLIVLGDGGGVDIQGRVLAELREPVVLLIGVRLVLDLPMSQCDASQGRNEGNSVVQGVHSLVGCPSDSVFRVT
jgi:hypothetical protein